MKRGLKGQISVADSRVYQNVTITSPMKRGLKGSSEPTAEAVVTTVTITSPMKRGLKVAYRASVGSRRGGYNHFPDEKGTERRYNHLDEG